MNSSRSVEDLLNAGITHMECNRLDEAANCFHRILAVDAGNAEANFKLANVLIRQNRKPAAEEAFRRALDADIKHHRAWYNLGNLLRSQGRLAEAEGCYRQVLVIEPGYTNAWINLGVIFESAGRFTDAEETYRRALLLDPFDPLTLTNLGNVLRQLERYEEARALYQQSIQIDPKYSSAWHGLGSVLNDLGRFDEAEIACRKSLDLTPDFPEANNSLGVILQSSGRFEEAESYFLHAVRVRPDYHSARRNLGSCLLRMGRPDEAVALYREILVSNPDDALAHNSLGGCLSILGRPNESISCFRNALQLDPTLFSAHSNLLFTLNYLGSNHHEVFESACRFGHAVGLEAKPFTSWRAPSHDAPLRVGFVSPDFRTHPVGYFLESFLPALDPSFIELHAYANVRQEDGTTNRLRKHFTSWRSIRGLGDSSAARLIHDDKVNILIDLAGHTTDNRLPLFGWRPAPVQATWLGYFATTGVREIDWLLATRAEIPVDAHDRFTESILYLRDSRLCFTAPHPEIQVHDSPVMQKGYITFGCFQNLAKISELVLTTWSRILSRIPRAHLRFQCPQLGTEAERSNLANRLVAHGIDLSCVSMHGAVSRNDYLCAHGEVDIILDTFPYPGGTTTCEALWMGVPTLTLAGSTMLERQGASILSAAGLSQWITHDIDSYIDRSISITDHIPELIRLRRVLRSQVLSSPLFDANRFARAFEDALRQMWELRSNTESSRYFA